MKEIISKGKNWKGMFSLVLTLAMVLTLMPMNSMTVLADGTTYHQITGTNSQTLTPKKQ